MTKLDSVLKIRDIALSTKVKVMVFPVVMYGCESWAIKKAEHRRIDAFELWCWHLQSLSKYKIKLSFLPISSTNYAQESKPFVLHPLLS